MSKHYSLGVYNYERQKLCDLYDSELQLTGQAYGIVATEEINGYHTLEFNIPYIIRSDDGGFDKNFRWDFLKSDYLIRLTDGTNTVWYVANKPQKKKAGKKIVGSVTCSGFESLLKTRNIYMEFNDTNGIGNMKYLMDQILMGSMWSYDESRSDILYENDGTTVKVRSLTSSNKQGALGAISTVCNLFQARPVFDTENQMVYVKSIKNRQQVLEGEVGRNLNALTAKYDSSNIATRVYVEGEYGDFGYVGIDDVVVDGQTWGLPFVVNFDYYRELGVFTQAHESALATYLEDIRAVKTLIRNAGLNLIGVEDELNNLIGQCKLVVYYVNDLENPRYTYGNVTSTQAALNINDDVVILKQPAAGETVGTHTYEKWTGDPTTQLVGAYGVAKFVTASAGKIGAAEVQIEAKRATIAELERKMNNLVAGDPKIAEYTREKEQMLAQINVIYVGNEENNDGLYEMMWNIMSANGTLHQNETLVAQIDDLNDQQDEIEATFIVAMGYMLRDGYWSNQNYITGQEQFLYADAVDMAKQMSRPAADYSFDFVRIVEDFGIPVDDIEVNAIFKIFDNELHVDERMFIKKVSYGIDDVSLGNIEVSNQDITLTGTDLGSLLSRMSQLADLIEQKNALYERAKAISKNGSVYAERLNGQIDVIRTQIMSSVSNWHTDDNGNIIFETADGTGAMMLSGAGFMLANSKDDQGNWIWRTLGTSNGITADEIVAGFLSADRIEAGSITSSHLSSEVGESLDLSSNTSLDARITNIAEEAAAEMQLTSEQFVVMFHDTVEQRIDDQIGDVQTDLDSYKSEVSAYMRYSEDGTLTLGKSGESFVAEITNQKLSFKDGDFEVAYISNQTMYITNANVTETLSIGDTEHGFFDWTVTATGLGLKWREPQFGDLTLSKTLISDKTGDDAVDFVFTIALNKRVNGTYGDVTFVDGVATVTLKGSESADILQLPAGVMYTITETPVAGFHIEEKTGYAGTISTTKIDAEFVNARDTGELEIRNRVYCYPYNAPSPTIDYTVTLSEPLTGTYGNMTFSNGVAMVSLLDQESAVANNIPVGTTYTIVYDSLEGYHIQEGFDEHENPVEIYEPVTKTGVISTTKAEYEYWHVDDRTVVVYLPDLDLIDIGALDPPTDIDDPAPPAPSNP